MIDSCNKQAKQKWHTKQVISKSPSVNWSLGQIISKVHIDEARPGTLAENESDSLADTTCLGKNFISLEYTRRTVYVYVYDTYITSTKNILIVTRTID